MEISEFRDLLANDGFAATFQTMGQYRTELLRALDGFRAQADARPYSDDEHTLMCAAENLRSVERNSDAAFRLASKLDDMRKRMAEASAPWLSEEVDRQNAGFDRCFEALGFPTDHGFERSWSSLVLEIHRTLARSSAATVAEPVPDFDVRRILIDVIPGPDGMGQEVYAKSVKDVEALLARMGEQIEELQAAQQQAKPPEQTSDAGDKPTEQRALANRVMRWNPLPGGGMNPHPSGMYVRFEDLVRAEPGADERAAFEAAYRNGCAEVTMRRNRDGRYEHDVQNTAWRIWQAARAAQSGQRAGVAEDDVLTGWVFNRRVDDGVCVVVSPSGSRFVAHPGTPVHELVVALMTEPAAAPTQQQEGGS